jgi:hypothetical protein
MRKRMRRGKGRGESVEVDKKMQSGKWEER